MTNTIPIFPTSPAPADMSRNMRFGDSLTTYDSGAVQGFTAWQRELWSWQFTLKNYQQGTVDSLSVFVRGRLGRTRPFFFSDPYDFRVNSQVIQNTGTAATTLQVMHPVGSYHVYPNSAALTLTSNLSGTLAAGIDFTLDHDTGYISLLVTPSSSDFITVQSAQFYRKCHFDKDYQDHSPIWQIFNVTISFIEVP